jgi:hypothetical protein
MTYWVLQQIHPRGKMALADEATAPALVDAVVTDTVVYGDYLEWSDPDAKDGLGDNRWTSDLAKAKKFLNFMAATSCWKAQSTVRPLRDDGKPNRPLTAFSISPVRIDT